MGRRKLNRRKECLTSARVDANSLYFSKDDGVRVSFSIHGLRFGKHRQHIGRAANIALDTGRLKSRQRVLAH